jgi:osmotically-inducible protein OsmY
MRIGLCALALVLGVAACDAAPVATPGAAGLAHGTARTGRDGKPQAPLATSPIPDDVALIREIHQKIIDSTTFSAEAQDVEVSAENGVVTLSGSVETEQEKAALVAIAREAPGVAGVRERLEVAKR